MRVTFAYPGGKARLSKVLVPFFPKSGGVYVEPCAGRGNSFFAAVQELDFSQWWLNDPLTGKFLRALKTVVGDVPPYSRSEYYKQWALFKEQNELAIVLEPYLTFGGGGYGSGGPIGKGNGPSQKGYQQTLLRAKTLLENTVVTALPWDALNLAKLTPDDFVYFDPPYNGTNVRSYRVKEFDTSRLLFELKSARYRWLLTEYDNSVIQDYLGSPFYRHELQLTGTNFNLKSGTRTECFWKNY